MGGGPYGYVSQTADVRMSKNNLKVGCKAKKGGEEEPFLIEVVLSTDKDETPSPAQPEDPKPSTDSKIEFLLGEGTDSYDGNSCEYSKTIDYRSGELNYIDLPADKFDNGTKFFVKVKTNYDMPSWPEPGFLMPKLYEKLNIDDLNDWTYTGGDRKFMDVTSIKSDIQEGVFQGTPFGGTLTVLSGKVAKNGWASISISPKHRNANRGVMPFIITVPDATGKKITA